MRLPTSLLIFAHSSSSFCVYKGYNISVRRQQKQDMSAWFHTMGGRSACTVPCNFLKVKAPKVGNALVTGYGPKKDCPSAAGPGSTADSLSPPPPVAGSSTPQRYPRLDFFLGLFVIAKNGKVIKISNRNPALNLQDLTLRVRSKFVEIHHWL
jgi:hypothetical protein